MVLGEVDRRREGKGDGRDWIRGERRGTRGLEGDSLIALEASKRDYIIIWRDKITIIERTRSRI